MYAIFTTKCALDLNMSVAVNGKFVTVKFNPAALYGVKGESLFSTTDPALITALKKHKNFGVYYFVKEESGVEAAREATEVVKTIEDELTNPENATIVESVTTKGMAVAYIQGMYGESFTATTVEDMKREAAQKWNTLFPKWGK